MNRLDSDELRRQLSENNQKIIELLASRGLQAIDASSNDVAVHICVMQLDKLGDE